MDAGKKGWDKALKRKKGKKFLMVLRDLDVLRRLKFPRSITPLEGQFMELVLRVFEDGHKKHAAHSSTSGGKGKRVMCHADWSLATLKSHPGLRLLFLK
jgi:hypothetical protein